MGRVSDESDGRVLGVAPSDRRTLLSGPTVERETEGFLGLWRETSSGTRVRT